MPIYSVSELYSEQLWAEFDWKQLKQKNQVMIRTQINKNKKKDRWYMNWLKDGSWNSTAKEKGQLRKVIVEDAYMALEIVLISNIGFTHYDCNMAHEEMLRYTDQ